MPPQKNKYFFFLIIVAKDLRKTEEERLILPHQSKISAFGQLTPLFLACGVATDHAGSVWEWKDVHFMAVQMWGEGVTFEGPIPLAYFL